MWQPQSPGVELKPVPNAPQPGQSANLRLTQMRNLAAQYSVIAEYRDKKEEVLRQLPTPVYRYSSEPQGVPDGALFAFARGTDSEAFLMNEARQGEDGAKWQHAFARFVGHASLEALRDERDVWQVDALPPEGVLDPKLPYFALRKYAEFPVVK